MKCAPRALSIDTCASAQGAPAHAHPRMTISWSKRPGGQSRRPTWAPATVLATKESQEKWSSTWPTQRIQKFDNNLCAFLAIKKLLSKSYSSTRVNCYSWPGQLCTKFIRHYRCKAKSQYHVDIHDLENFPPSLPRTEEA